MTSLKNLQIPVSETHNVEVNQFLASVSSIMGTVSRIFPQEICFKTGEEKKIYCQKHGELDGSIYGLTSGLTFFQHVGVPSFYLVAARDNIVFRKSHAFANCPMKSPVDYKNKIGSDWHTFGIYRFQNECFVFDSNYRKDDVKYDRICTIPFNFKIKYTFKYLNIHSKSNVKIYFGNYTDCTGGMGRYFSCKFLIDMNELIQQGNTNFRDLKNLQYQETKF